MNNYCRNCGEKLEGDKECQKCGTKVSNTRFGYFDEELNKKYKIIFFILLGLVLLDLVFCFFSLTYRIRNFSILVLLCCFLLAFVVYARVKLKYSKFFNAIYIFFTVVFNIIFLIYIVMIATCFNMYC